MDKLFLCFYLSLLVLCTVYFSYRWSLHRKFSLTEIYSDTQLMQKYRDISLKGGFLPHATLRRWLTWDKRSFWAVWTVVSARLAVCPAERERDPSGCRASGVTPELPVHVLMVPPPLVPLRPSHRHCYFLDFPRKFRIRPLWWL